MKKLEGKVIQDIDQIREITKGTLKDLGEFLNSGFTQVPVFGYPPVCYSPTQQLPKFVSRSEERDLPPNKGSLWRHLCRGIYSNVKEGQKMIIRDLLDSHDDVAENYNDILMQFTNGRQLSKKHVAGGDFLRVSKRGIKKRDEHDVDDDKSKRRKRKKHRHRKGCHRKNKDRIETQESGSKLRKVLFEQPNPENDAKSSIITESEEFESSNITSEDENSPSQASMQSFKPRMSLAKLRRNATMLDNKVNILKRKTMVGLLRQSTVVKNKLSNEDLRKLSKSNKIIRRQDTRRQPALQADRSTPPKVELKNQQTLFKVAHIHTKGVHKRNEYSLVASREYGDSAVPNAQSLRLIRPIKQFDEQRIRDKFSIQDSRRLIEKI